MTCCIARPVRPIVFSTDDIGKHQEFAEFDCECNSCCKRVALFAPRPNIVASSAWIIKVIADITFGCKKCFGYGGNVEVDFKNGVILDLMGDYVSIAYKVIEVIDPIGEVTPIPPMTFGAMIACCGAGAARGKATRTTEQFTVEPNAAFISIPIPPFAYAVSFAPVTASVALFFSATTIIEQLGSGTSSNITGASGNNFGSATTGSEYDPWLLVGGARNILVINTAGAGSITFEAVFHIGV